MASSDTWALVAASAVTAISTLGATWLGSWNIERQRRRKAVEDEVSNRQTQTKALFLEIGRLKAATNEALIELIRRHATGVATEVTNRPFGSELDVLVSSVVASAIVHFPNLHPTIQKFQADIAKIPSHFDTVLGSAAEKQKPIEQPPPGGPGL